MGLLTNNLFAQGHGVEQILEHTEPNYYLNLRKFPQGYEAVLKTVRPMKMAALNGELNSRFYKNASEVSLSERPFNRSQNEEVDSDFKALQNYNRAIRRARQNIRWLCKVMEADRLFTLTYRENQIDREQTRADFKKFLRLVRSGWRGQVGIPDWQYVAVLETQERGAFHIHCAVKGYQRIKFLRAAWYKALGGSGNETGADTPGAVNVTNPDKARWGHTGRQWKVNKLSGYLTKYLGKTFCLTDSEKRRYWHSRSLHTPVIQKFWLGSSNIVSAIKSTVSLLGEHVGIRPDFAMWLSTSEDTFWISGGLL